MDFKSIQLCGINASVLSQQKESAVNNASAEDHRLPKTTGESSMTTKTDARASYPEPSPSTIVGSILAMGVTRILEQKEDSVQKRVSKSV
jgi:hypothetical protein